MPDTITTAVPQQTPPANAIQHPAKVYLLSRRLPDIVHLVQYDQTLPVLAVELLQGDAPYTVPDGAAVNIRMAKPVPSTKKVYNPAYGISSDRHTVYIQVTPQMTVVAGCTNPVIEVVVDGGVACTGTLRLEIDPNPVQESDIIDTDEYLTIQEILAEAQEAAKVVQDNEQALQDVHNNLAAIQNAAANAQAAAASAQDAEEAADRAAIESQKALGFRSYFGGQVVPDANGDLDPSRPMSTPTAASVTIKARGDRIAGLTMAGKTTQAGTGDPSPENIRMIHGIGWYDAMIVWDGSSDESIWSASAQGAFFTDFPASAPEANWYISNSAKSSWASVLPIDTGSAEQPDYSIVPNHPSTGQRRILLKINSSISTVADARAYLADHPLYFWYHSNDYYKSTGPFYTVVELSDDPYRAVGFELTQPLFDGDTLQVGVPSGCDQMIVLDGSADEQFRRQAGGKEGFYYFEVTTSVAPVIPQSSKIVGQILSDLYPARPTDKGYQGEKSVGIASNGKVCIFDPDLVTETALRDNLAAHPLTILYRSTEYTEENDIPVALEKHEREQVYSSTGVYNANNGSPFAEIRIPSSAAGEFTFICNRAKYPGYQRLNYGDAYIAKVDYSGLALGLVGSGIENQNALDLELEARPVQVVYELATPVSYAHPVPTMIALPGEDGTFTVTGENSLSVLLKPFQDGGDAATIEGHTWADIQKLISGAVTSAIALSK